MTPLYKCAEVLDLRADEIVKVVGDETGLLEPRLRAELERTTGQLRMLSDYAATPWRRTSPGITTVPVAVGPVAVFAASNFPLAFGVLGGDTGSAVAAGCPVVVKAHPAQPKTAELLGAVGAAALPEFELVYGGADKSLELVRDPRIRAVGFTGSLAGGRALMDAAAARPDPIPVYAEMGSLNPVFVLPSYDGDVSALAASVTNSSGQLCTKPNLVVTPSEEFAVSLAEAVATGKTHRMLTPAMAAAHAAWLEQASGLGRVYAGDSDPRPFALVAHEFDPSFLEEHFGPSVVIYVGDSIPAWDGSLTATILAADDDHDSVRDLLPALMNRAGRIIFNGVPTGVAVVDAMHHGGPWPATSAPWSTSVGPASVERFRRPVALQGFPEELVPGYR
ncbi:aldehyde dehydrogenase family protein [Allorhizocola rhizosphaerae]|uniref:aldehyde dehydrogenase family protein n=1 Tax=Allorhizocola rhizosphaerae TaxID=1872709 RepID=UPI000E3DC61D|nr:aldehyde dehydrogenase family protein [Allorhizocola rhizosphaerae]